MNFAQRRVGRGRRRRPDDATLEDGRAGDGRAEIVERVVRGRGSGARAGALPHGEPCDVRRRVRFDETSSDPLFGVVLQNDRDQTVFAASTAWTQERSGTFRAGDDRHLPRALRQRLRGGRYLATPAVARRGAGIAWIDRREKR